MSHKMYSEQMVGFYKYTLIIIMIFSLDKEVMIKNQGLSEGKELSCDNNLQLPMVFTSY